jgi:probable HAF family extracellular repeat protein
VAVIAVNLCLSKVGAAVLYHLTDIGDLPGGEDGSGAQGINSLGQVVGNSRTAPLINDPVPVHGYIWTATTGPQDLGALSGDASEAHGINNNGQVAGEYYSVDANLLVTNEHAVVWTSPGVVQEIGHFPGDDFSTASAINNNGQVVGVSQVLDSVGSGHPYIWSSSGGMQSVGALAGGDGTGTATAINDSGQVVGVTKGANGSSFGYRWMSASGIENLGQFGPTGINNSGDVIGESVVSSLSEVHAFLWRSATGLQDLGKLPGRNTSIAFGVNSADNVVGWSFTTTSPIPQSHAFLWTVASGMQDLNNLVDASAAGWTLFNAFAINDAGQIVGNGRSPSGASHGYLLTPVPEPSAILLVALSFLAVGTWRLRTAN